MVPTSKGNEKPERISMENTMRACREFVTLYNHVIKDEMACSENAHESSEGGVGWARGDGGRDERTVGKMLYQRYIHIHCRVPKILAHH
jgi:hypothetical protein